MHPSDSTFNELHVREKQYLLAAIVMWLNDEASVTSDRKLQNELINKVIDLMEVDKVLSYFVDYEITTTRFLHEARLENLKLKSENNTLKDTINNLQKSLDECAQNL